MLLLVLALVGTQPIQGTLQSVIDGNTIVVARVDNDGKTRTDLVRVVELDCPSVSTTSGQLARKRAQTLWPVGTKLVLRPAQAKFKKDKQRRTVAKVEWPNADYIGEMVKDRLCRSSK